MRTLRIPFPDISRYQKTRLSEAFAFGASQDKLSDIKAGSSSLYFRNTLGFAPDDFFIIEAFESNDAEVCQIQNIDPQSHIVELADSTYQPHLVGSVIMRMPYNQVKVFKGSTGVITSHTEITGSPFVLRPDTSYTYIYDELGTSSDYYSYQYWIDYTGYVGHSGYSGFSGYSGVSQQVLYSETDYDSVLTVANLKDWFMFGLDLTDDDGYPFPTPMFEFAIRVAIDSLEKTLNIKIKPTTIYQEFQDFYASDYRDFAFIQLNHYPLISVENVYIWYPTAQAPILFPHEWYQIRKERGQVNLIPTSGSLSNILMGRGGDYLTFVWRGYDFMPNLWRIDYTAGLGSRDANNNIVTEVPSDLVGVIGKMACFYPLAIAGDLVGGIAVASKSIGIDGLSQSLNTTSCVHPDVLVLVDGEYKKISEVGVATKIWDGDLISFYVKGKNISPTTITPDHLVLTGSGWKAAENLFLSDSIDQGGSFERIERLEKVFFKGQLYDMVLQPDGKYVTFQGVIHNSPENAGYSARLRQYEKELKLEIKRLQSYFWGLKMVSL